MFLGRGAKLKIILGIRLLMDYRPVIERACIRLLGGTPGTWSFMFLQAELRRKEQGLHLSDDLFPCALNERLP